MGKMPEPKLTVEREKPYEGPIVQIEYKDGQYQYTEVQEDKTEDKQD